ncbi:enoyl-CoA hydratase/isomerase family protein [Bradyrhizobium sp. 190]|uniref:enoyl-CoA hydratase-related protein n=1 Tax=Bradyrhizobium sp. 190 TaxID=2782658 RepID=UPI001FFAA0F6|nr:enoyl-CoA hydratase-related protein [Bradyrhizobium sp. 190]MCK1513191.1 enoyl-CoA hydratase/isomerase family protein [Bradyrhizobium sp. 190]
MGSGRVIIYTVEERVATIVLNRPERLNAWTPIMARELRETLYDAGEREDVSVIVLTGAGRSFCAGADLRLLDGTLEAPGHTSSALNDPLGECSFIRSVAKPIIGAINGSAAGLGLALALYCDIRFAAENAVFITSFGPRGQIAEHGIARLLRRLMGSACASGASFSSPCISAAQALQCGLVTRVCEPDKLLQEAKSFALSLAQNASPRSLEAIKRQIYVSADQSLEEALGIADMRE